MLARHMHPSPWVKCALAPSEHCHCARTCGLGSLPRVYQNHHNTDGAHASHGRQMPGERHRRPDVVFVLGRPGIGDDRSGARLHVVDQDGRELGIDRRGSWRAGRSLHSVHGRAQPRAVLARRHNQRRHAECRHQPGGRTVCVYAEPGRRRDVGGRRPARCRRHDNQRLQLERDERVELDRRVVGAERKRQRNGRAGGSGQRGSFAGGPGEDRRPELHGDPGSRGAAAPGAGPTARTGAGARPDPRAVTGTSANSLTGTGTNATCADARSGSFPAAATRTQKS
jgi:hypothetical protein